MVAGRALDRPGALVGLVIASVVSAVVAAHPANSSAATGLHDEGFTIIAAGSNLSQELSDLHPGQRARVYVGDRFPQRVPSIDDYYASGRAERDRIVVVEQARGWLTHWAQESCPNGLARCHAAVVVDIDDTLLDSVPFYAHADPPFTHDVREWRRFRDGCRQPAIISTRMLVRRLHRSGWHIVLVTGRESTNRTQTRRCLHLRGVTGWDALIMRAPADSATSAAQWKEQQRALLVGRGWQVVASIGDQRSDMDGHHVLRGFLLPNAIYATP